MFSSYTFPRVGTKSFSLVQNAFLQADDLPFRDVLTEEEIHAAFVAEDACFGEDEDDIYTPALTLWGWLAQVMQAEKARSCVAAVARITALCVALGRKPPSPDTGAYCRARAKLPEARAPAIGLHGGRWAGVARAGGLAVAGPAREDGRWHDAADPRHGRQPGSLAPGADAEARPGVSHPADGRVDLLGHGRLVRAGDRTVQGQGDGRAGLAARVAGPFPARRCVLGRLRLLLPTSCWRCCWPEAWTW